MPAPLELKNRSFCPLRNSEILAQGAAAEVMLFDMSSGQYYALNDLGARIWEFSDGDHTAEAMAASLEAEYDASYATILEDVLSLIQDLSRNGLLIHQND